MQAPLPDPFPTNLLFSRERRRERMLKFLEAFERRSWRAASELPYLLPFTKAETREPDLPSERAH